ncbi:MAG: peptidylprolyl isomerase [Nitrospirae bacterium]|nr:MAG: peptidylprolyl isomerase [Nitrospirota bacterium]
MLYGRLPKQSWYFVILIGILSPISLQAEQPKGGRMTIAAGQDVSIEYTLKLDNDQVIDSNVGGEPLTYTHGAKQIIPGLEEALEGMAVGETKHVTIAPEDGYGPVNPNAFQEVPKELIPPEALQVGTQLQGRDASGRIVHPRIAEIKENTVVLDFNHPLAGKTLHFDVKVLDIQKSHHSQTP